MDTIILNKLDNVMRRQTYNIVNIPNDINIYTNQA